MKVLQIGYGKMGQFISNALKNCSMISKLVVSDLKFSEPFEEYGVRFIGDFNNYDISSFDCAFVSTTAITHCEVVEMLIKAGIKNIYIEKPAVMNKAEFDRINRIKGDCKIVTGYILRQSEPMFALKCIIDKMILDNYQMELCSVTYQKYLPNFAEERAKDDIGVFEEIVHIWDLLFNYLEFNLAKCEILDTILESDPDRNERKIYAKLSYYLRFKNSNALLRLTASFRADEKRREFFFTFKNEKGDRRHIYLSFDNEDGLDWLIVTEANGKTLYKEAYTSLEKLDHQVEEVINYFRTGKQYNLSLLEESATVLDLLREAGVYL